MGGGGGSNPDFCQCFLMVSLLLIYFMILDCEFMFHEALAVGHLCSLVKGVSLQRGIFAFASARSWRIFLS